MTDHAANLGLLLPKSLVLKNSPKGYQGIGVFVVKKIKEGVVYGPYKGKAVSMENVTPVTDTSRMWEVSHKRSFAHFIDGNSDNTGNNWLKYIRCAKYKEEQNVEVFQIGMDLFFRVLRPLLLTEELIAWYSDKQAESLEINGTDGTELMEEDENGEGFSCTACGHTFTYEDFATKYILTPEYKEPRISWDCSCCLKILTSLYSTTKHLRHQEVYKKYFSPTFSDDGTYLYNQKEKTYYCPKCSRNSKRFSFMKNHVLLHNLPRTFHCGICKKDFRYNWLFVKHSLIHKPKFFKCSGYSCKKKFFSREILLKHAEVCKHRKPYNGAERKHACSQCNKRFTKMYSLKRHMYVHSGENKPYACHLCPQTFISNHALNCHLQAHKKGTAKKPKNVSAGAEVLHVKSAERRLLFVAEEKLAELEPLHVSGRQPNDVPEENSVDARDVLDEREGISLNATKGNSGNTSEGRLVVDKTVNETEGNLVFSAERIPENATDKNPVNAAANHKGNLADATGCPVTAAQVSTGGAPIHSCKQCKVDFFSSLLYISHMQSFHNVGNNSPDKSNKCNTCDKVFKRRYSLARHIKNIHDYGEKKFKCGLCSKGFNDKWSYNRHLKNQHTQRLELPSCRCSKCLKRFKTNEQLSVHICTKEYGKCLLCDTPVSDHVVNSPPEDVNRPTEDVNRPIPVKHHFKCCACGTIVSEHQNLKRHAKVHRGERLNQCFYCASMFTQKSSLDKHLKNVHGQSTSITASAEQVQV